MTFWGNFAIFETTVKNLVLERWVPSTPLQYEKKMEKFIKIKSCPKIMKFRYFGEKLAELFRQIQPHISSNISVYAFS